MYFCGLMSGAPEGSTGSGSGLKRLRRQGHGWKSHPRDRKTWGTHCLWPYLGCNQCWAGGFTCMIFVGFWYPGAPEGSTGSGYGFKASQKTGPRFKVTSDILGEREIEVRTPGYKARDTSTTSRRPTRSWSVTWIVILKENTHIK